MNCARIELLPSSNHRQSERTHLFVIATLCSDAGSAPVHIRNMSIRGALIEAPVLPNCGAIVVLKRGSLEVGGRIAWTTGRKAGLALDAAVTVYDWMAKHSNVEQDYVDAIVESLRQSSAHSAARAEGSVEPTGIALIERELGLLHADLSRLGNSLASDVIMVATHPEMQILDISMQRVERIRRELKSLR